MCETSRNMNLNSYLLPFTNNYIYKVTVKLRVCGSGSAYIIYMSGLYSTILEDFRYFFTGSLLPLDFGIIKR